VISDLPRLGLGILKCIEAIDHVTHEAIRVIGVEGCDKKALK
jgi:hypothetical protein